MTPARRCGAPEASVEEFPTKFARTLHSRIALALAMDVD